ncbi:hypothetical protein [Clostridium sp.]|uniref:hypothetical protein n=1 Tax=Clostridium sp. TaxID=1506 RepID=UPI0032167EA3
MSNQGATFALLAFGIYLITTCSVYKEVSVPGARDSLSGDIHGGAVYLPTGFLFFQICHLLHS